jgi:hypothetical protein
MLNKQTINNIFAYHDSSDDDNEAEGGPPAIK